MQKMQVFLVLFQKIMKDLLLGPTHQVVVLAALVEVNLGPVIACAFSSSRFREGFIWPWVPLRFHQILKIDLTAVHHA